MSTSKEQLEGMIKELRASAEKLESIKGKSEEEIAEHLNNANANGCCNACVVISPCVDLKHMCSGGCTEISFIL